MWVVLGALTAAMWLARLVVMGPMLRRRNPLTPRSIAALPADCPKVSVLVAAKDEEKNIAPCITTLLSQDYPSLEVIAIDDRSNDRTGKILADLAAGSADRMRVVTIKHLPANWFGKAYAMREGLKRATGQWLLFTDADCVFDTPRAVSIAVAHAIEKGTDFLTIIPSLQAPTWWERVFQPVCAIVLMFWFQPDKVNHPRSPCAYANGAFMLIRRAALETMGGYEAVRGHITEDTKLAQIAKGIGLSLRVEENAGLYHTRMYETMWSAFGGWSRIFAGALVRPGKVILAIVLLAIFSVGPWVGFALALGWGSSHAGGAKWAIAVWGLAVVLKQAAMLRLYGAIGFGRIWSLGYPVGSVGMLLILCNALLKTSGLTTTTWKNTTYRAGGESTESSSVGTPEPAPVAENSTS